MSEADHAAPKAQTPEDEKLYNKLLEIAENMHPLSPKEQTLCILNSISRTLEDPSFLPKVSEDIKANHPEKDRNNLEEERSFFYETTVPKWRDKVLPAARDFVSGENFDLLCEVFPDAGKWFMDRFSDVLYLNIGEELITYIIACLPVMRSVLEEKYPGWKPGAVSMYTLFPDLTEADPDMTLLDSMLSRSSKSEGKSKAESSEIRKSLSTDVFSDTRAYPTNRAASHIFTKDFFKNCLVSHASEPVTGGLVCVPVKDIGRSTQENLYVRMDGEVSSEDMDVLNAVSSVYHFVVSSNLQNVQDGSPVRISTDSIYRTMVGRKGITASPTMKRSILASLSRLQKTTVLVLDPSEVERISQNGDISRVKDRFSLTPLLPCQILGETVNGNELQYVELYTMPPLLDMALKTGQKILCPSAFLDVQEVDKKTGLPTGVRIPATRRRISIRNHLAPRVQGINEGFKRKKPGKGAAKYGLDNQVINLDNFFGEIDIPNTGDARKKNRRDIAEQLDFLTAAGNIDGWKWMQYNAADKKAGKRGYGRVRIFPKGWIEYEKQLNAEKDKSKKTEADK